MSIFQVDATHSVSTAPLDASLLRGVRETGARVATGRSFSISRSYVLWITAQVALRFLILVLLVESLFLSEHFLDILRGFSGEISSVGKLIFLVGLSAPAVYFALPVVTVVAVYLVVLKCREQRELIVWASTGLGSRQIVTLGCAWGITALLISLFVTGIILPYSQFAFRSNLHAFRKEILRTGGATSHFYYFPGMTVYEWPRNSHSRPDSLFVYQRKDAQLERVITITAATIAGSGQPSDLNLSFKDVLAVDLPDFNTPLGSGSDHVSEVTNRICGECTSADNSVLRAHNYAQSLDLDQLLPLQPRGAASAEWTTAELIGITVAPNGLPKLERRSELMDRITRSILCLIAPFVALLAVALTSRRTQPFALVLACCAVLCLDVIGLGIDRTLSKSGIIVAISGVVGPFVAVFGAMVWQITRLESSLVRPASVKV
jgi:lipopolysaccharide export LptBFGC system permease protein LptF